MTFGQRSLGSVFGDIAGNIQQILRGEMQLAKAELVEEAGALKTGAVLLFIGAVLGFLGLACLTVTVVALLALALPLWVAALIVAMFVLAAAGACGVAGLNEVKRMRGLPRTVASVQETVQWPRS